MMSLPVWLPGPMFLPAHVPQGVSVWRGVLCPRGSLSGKPTGQRSPCTVKSGRTVRILLECSLVTIVFTEKKNEDHLAEGSKL